MIPTVRPALIATALALAAGPATAQGYRTVGYAPAYGYESGGYGFADEAVRGAYVGAPLTRFPSPDRIVAAPWSYGTYGIPTVSGIRAAPVAPPSLTRIQPEARAVRPSPGARVLSRGGDGRWHRASRPDPSNGVHVVDVTVPRR